MDFTRELPFLSSRTCDMGRHFKGTVIRAETTTVESLEASQCPQQTTIFHANLERLNYQYIVFRNGRSSYERNLFVRSTFKVLSYGERPFRKTTVRRHSLDDEAIGNHTRLYYYNILVPPVDFVSVLMNTEACCRKSFLDPRIEYTSAPVQMLKNW